MYNRNETAKRVTPPSASSIRQESAEHRKNIRATLNALHTEINQQTKQRSQERKEKNSLLKKEVSSLLNNYRQERQAKLKKLIQPPQLSVNEESNSPINQTPAIEQLELIDADLTVTPEATAQVAPPQQEAALEQALPLAEAPATIIPIQDSPPEVTEAVIEQATIQAALPTATPEVQLDTAPQEVVSTIKPLQDNLSEEPLQEQKVGTREIDLSASAVATATVPSENQAASEGGTAELESPTNTVTHQDNCENISQTAPSLPTSEAAAPKMQQESTPQTVTSPVISVQVVPPDEHKVTVHEDASAEVMLAAVRIFQVPPSETVRVEVLPSAENLADKTLNKILKIIGESENGLTLEEISREIETADAERLVRRLIKRHEIRKEGERYQIEKPSGEAAP